MKLRYSAIFYILVFCFFLACTETEALPEDDTSEEQEEQVDDADDNSDDDTTSEVSLVLVFTKTAGFNHNTKEEIAELVRQIGEEQNFEVTVSDDAAIFNNQDSLNDFDIVFFTNTSGATLNTSQQDNVEEYASQGGHFISNHAASDSYAHSSASTVNGGGKGEWNWYSENVTGCSVRNGPNHTANNFEATVSVQNQNDNLTTEIAFPWTDREEWYYWEGGYLNSDFTELLRVSDTGSETYDDPRMTAHFLERPDGGISFYTSMGHGKDKYSDADFVQLMKNVFTLMLSQ